MSAASQSSGRFAWGLATLVLVVLLALNLLPDRVAHGVIEPALWKVHAAITRLGQGTDSWKCMITAYDHIQASAAQPLYQTIFFDQETKFQYPPTALLVLAAFDAAGVAPGDRLGVFFAVSWLWFGLAFWALARIAAVAADRLAAPGYLAGSGERALLVSAALIAGVVYYPLTQSFRNGQIQLWITAAALLAVAGWLRGQEGRAGMWLGLASLAKPHIGLLLIWGLARRKWRFSAGLASVVAAGLLASIARFGLTPHLGYLDVIRFLARHGESYWSNQSLAGLLYRWPGVGKNMAWADSFPSYSPAIHGASLAFAAGLLGLALVLPARRPGAGGAIDLTIMMTSVTLAAPIAWRHHYGMMLAAFPLLVVLATRLERRRGPHLALIVVAFVATGTFFRGTEVFAGTSLSALTSLTFFGGLLVLALLHAMQPLEATAPGPAP